ncbi:hypothetical protein ACVXHB_20875 [Escherichia coli]
MTVLDGDITPQDISELVALAIMRPFRTGSGALNGRERDGQCAKTGANAHKWSCLCDRAAQAVTGWKMAGVNINRPSKLMW